ncbi:agamous-like MADS-box protein AGL29 [Humulus lupulus]|uniref:agamous-like MADS-box protein AGL29 n=1 Tax=Humulus lupulus TaxID=3486 RepID=UPI002B40D182|nr:agamous-like MADS-box protein AGL29 [Humulus lupulus]
METSNKTTIPTTSMATPTNPTTPNSINITTTTDLNIQTLTLTSTPININNNNNNPTSPKAKRKTKGRQKIEMKMIQEEDSRLITFSKRRSGIYKKASELVTLCGAEVGVVIFSPSGKPFSYGHPSIDAVASHFLLRETDPQTAAMLVDVATHPIVEAHRRVRIDELNQQYNTMCNDLDAEKETLKEFKKMTELGSTPRMVEVTLPEPAQGWWDASIEGLSLDELKQRYRTLEELHENISKQVNKERMMTNDSTTANATTTATTNNNAPNISSSHSFVNLAEHQSTTGIHASHHTHMSG